MSTSDSSPQPTTEARARPPSALWAPRTLWSLVVVAALLIPWMWHVLPLPASLGQVLRLAALDWMQLSWLTSLTLLVLSAQRLLPASALPATPSEAAARMDAYSAAYRMLPDPAGITRVADGQFLDVNPAFCQLMGLPLEQIIGRTNYELQIYATDQERPRLLEHLSLHGSVDRMPIADCRLPCRVSPWGARYRA